ncbi:hypothetical protein GIB67_012988 [Kingdonia uniflora]|uniref:Uncharacterized protein n=1 Tax=Kingdonia uniflora TaxID=39325 RepID=A0A7J7MCD6_9MAGN|nr:hypothetical protein GIB67_012988 [Kingdonia uniflora]
MPHEEIGVLGGILGTTCVQTCGLSMSTLATIILPESYILYYFYLFAYYSFIASFIMTMV